MSIEKLKKGYRVHIKFTTPDGEHVRRTKKNVKWTLRDAEAWERQEISKLTTGSSGRATAGAATVASSPTVKEFSEQFLNWARSAQNKPSEVEMKASHLNRHLLDPLGSRRLHEVDALVIDTLKGSLLAKGLKEKTVKNVLQTLRKMLKLALRYKLITAVPEFNLQKTKSPEHAFLTPVELDQLVAATVVDPMLQLAVLLAADAGLRAGELRALRWTDVHVAEGHLVVRHAMWTDVEGTPKSGRDRTVTITPRLRDALKGSRSLCSHVLIRKDGTPWTKECLRWSGRRAYRLAKLEAKLTGEQARPWHTLRHTYVSNLMAAGVTPHVVQQLAGHENIKTTMGYAHKAEDALRRAAEQLAQYLSSVSARSSSRRTSRKPGR